jgi:hypothetical protein
MSKENRDFNLRPEDEKKAFLEKTWCNECMKVDLGMKNPKEYEEDGRVFIEGECLTCGTAVVTEIVDGIDEDEDDEEEF